MRVVKDSAYTGIVVEYEDGRRETLPPYTKIPGYQTKYELSQIRSRELAQASRERSLAKQRTKPTKARKRIKPNSKRQKTNRKKNFHLNERVDYIKSLPCLVCGNTPSDNEHVRSRGAGGTYKDIVPLCRTHHNERHQLGRDTFGEKYGKDFTHEVLLKKAAEIELQWLNYEKEFIKGIKDPQTDAHRTSGE